MNTEKRGMNLKIVGAIVLAIVIFPFFQRLSEASLPDWIQAAASAIGLAMIWTGIDQWKREKHRDQVDRASQLISWWISGYFDGNEYHEFWGLMIANNAQSMFYDIIITYADQYRSDKEFHIKSLPPGRYIISEEDGFKQPRPFDCDTQPISQTDKFRIISIQFRDPINQRWMWDPETGIHEIV